MGRPSGHHADISKVSTCVLDCIYLSQFLNRIANLLFIVVHDGLLSKPTSGGWSVTRGTDR